METSYPEAAVSEQPSQLSHRAEQGNTGINCSAVLAARARSSARAPLGHEDQHSLVCHAVLPLSFHSLQTIHRWTPFVAPHLGRNLRQRLLQQGGQPKLPAPAPPEALPGSCNTSLTVLLHLPDVRSSLIQFSCCSKMPEISVAFLEQQQCWGCSKVCTGSRCGKGEQQLSFTWLQSTTCVQGLRQSVSSRSSPQAQLMHHHRNKWGRITTQQEVLPAPN